MITITVHHVVQGLADEPLHRPPHQRAELRVDVQEPAAVIDAADRLAGRRQQHLELLREMAMRAGGVLGGRDVPAQPLRLRRPPVSHRAGPSRERRSGGSGRRDE